MKLVKAMLLGLLLSMGVSVVTITATAQQPAPSGGPTVHVPITIPLIAPHGWDAKQWAAFRQQCQTIKDKSESGIALTRGEFEEADACSAASPPNPSVTHEPELPQAQFRGSPRAAAGLSGHAKRSKISALVDRICAAA